MGKQRQPIRELVALQRAHRWFASDPAATGLQRRTTLRGIPIQPITSSKTSRDADINAWPTVTARDGELENRTRIAVVLVDANAQRARWRTLVRACHRVQAKAREQAAVFGRQMSSRAVSGRHNIEEETSCL